MRLVQNMRTSVNALFTVGTLMVLGACGDSPTLAPSAEAPFAHAPANFIRTGTTVTFRVNNSQGVTQEIGDHILYLDPGAICDLSSSYGPSTWDNDCKPMKGWVTITATLFQGPNSEAYVDFQPAMRFVPNKQAYLFLRADRTNAETQMKRLLVKYCNNAGVCIDESLNDGSLKPFRVDQYGIVGRRVKHFSGYVLAFENCPEGETCGLESMARRSGYMVASGEDDVVDRLIKSGVFDPDTK